MDANYAEGDDGKEPDQAEWDVAHGDERRHEERKAQPVGEHRGRGPRGRSLARRTPGPTPSRRQASCRRSGPRSRAGTTVRGARCRAPRPARRSGSGPDRRRGRFPGSAGGGRRRSHRRRQVRWRQRAVPNAPGAPPHSAKPVAAWVGGGRVAAGSRRISRSRSRATRTRNTGSAHVRAASFRRIGDSRRKSRGANARPPPSPSPPPLDSRSPRPAGHRLVGHRGTWFGEGTARRVGSGVCPAAPGAIGGP